MKKLVLCLPLVIIIIFSSILVLQCRYPSIRKGIKMSEAKRRADSEEGYFIVTQSGGATGARFIIAYGSDKGTEVELNGNCPAENLSNIFFLSKHNFFLLRGNEKTSTIRESSS